MRLTSPPEPTGSTGSRILRSFSLLLSTQLVTWLLTAVYVIIAPRYLGPANQGRLTLAYAIIYLINIFCELGMSKLAVRELARDPAQARSLISALLVWRLGLGVLAYAALLVGVGWLEGAEAYRPIFYFVGLTMILDGLYNTFTALFQGLERFKYSAWLDITVKVVILALALAVIGVGGPVWAMAAATTGAYAVAIVEGLWWSRRIVRLTWRVSLRKIGWLVRHGLPLWGTAVFLVIYTYIDSLLLGILTNETVVGLYAAPVRLFTTAMFLPGALSAAVFPTLARLYTTDRPAMIALAGLSLRWLVSASMPIAVLVAALSPGVIPLLYGPAYVPSVPVMAILGLTIFSTYVSILTNQFLVASNRQLAWTWVMAAATVINPLLNLGLINYFQAAGGNGAIGAAWSLFITETLMLLPAFYLMPRGIFTRALVLQTGRVALACVPMAAVAVWLNSFFFLVPALAGLAVFGLVAWLLHALPLHELAQARRLLLERNPGPDVSGG